MHTCLHTLLHRSNLPSQAAAPSHLPAPPTDNIKYFYDIKDRGDFRANPDYKGVCHVALAQEGHCKPGALQGRHVPTARQGRW